MSLVVVLGVIFYRPVNVGNVALSSYYICAGHAFLSFHVCAFRFALCARTIYPIRVLVSRLEFPCPDVHVFPFHPPGRLCVSLA